jgi:hypothetical protein
MNSLRAVQQIAGKLRAGGLFLGSIRDYDQIVEQHPAMPATSFLPGWCTSTHLPPGLGLDQ